MSTPDELATRLQQITADLDGYLQRRASELAAPIIAEQQAAADAAIAELQTRLQRAEDVFTECRRQIVNLENRLDDLRIKHGERRDQQVAARRDEQTRQRLAVLPADTRPLPTTDAYDQLLPRTTAARRSTQARPEH